LHAGRPRPWPHCVRWGPSSPSPRERGTAGCSPLFLAHLYCGNGRPSQLLLSSCCILVIYTVSQKTSHIWLAITLTHMHRFWYCLAGMLPIKWAIKRLYTLPPHVLPTTYRKTGNTKITFFTQMLYYSRALQQLDCIARTMHQCAVFLKEKSYLWCVL